MTQRAKTLLIGLGIFAAVVTGVFVVYTLQKPTETPVPSIKPKVVVSPSPVAPVVNEVAPAADKCVLTFTVAAETTPGLSCEAKELYKDVGSNTAGTYALTAANKLASGFQLVPGETYIYRVSYKNTGTAAVGGKVEDILPAGLTYKDSTDGCTYASTDRKVTCNIASVAASGNGQVAIRFTVEANTDKTSFANTATVIPTTGQSSTCSLTNPIKTTASANPSVSPSPSNSAAPQAKLDCVVKRVYKDASNNAAGQYYLNEEIVDTATLQNGQTVVYNVVVANKGGASVSDTTITDVLSSNLTYLDGESGCTYAAATRTVTCTVGSLAGNTEVSKSFRAKITTAGATAIANTADVSSTNGQRDSCSITVNAAGQVVQPPSPAPTELPQAGVFEVTTGTLGIGLLLLILGALGLLLI